jgi:hypothetical protein
MAMFEEHCRDCERVLGNRHEAVNRWIDELFRIHGPKHRRFRHCWKGVREAAKKFGAEGAKAAIVHIVRDCGGVPDQRAYDETQLGIVLAPEYLVYDGANETAFEKFKKAVEAEFEKAAAKLGAVRP